MLDEPCFYYLSSNMMVELSTQLPAQLRPAHRRAILKNVALKRGSSKTDSWYSILLRIVAFAPHPSLVVLMVFEQYCVYHFVLRGGLIAREYPTLPQYKKSSHSVQFSVTDPALDSVFSSSIAARIVGL